VPGDFRLPLLTARRTDNVVLGIPADDQPPGQVALSFRARPLILVSDCRPPSFVEAVAAEVGADVTPMGPAGAKAMAVVRGEADADVQSGGQWEWDPAAPVGVAPAAGLHPSRLDGRELRYDQPHPYLPDLVICQHDLAQRLIDAIALVIPKEPPT